MADVLKEIEADLAKKQGQIQKLENKLSAMRKDIAELEAAFRVVQRYSGNILSSAGPSGTIPSSLSGLSGTFPDGEHAKSNTIPVTVTDKEPAQTEVSSVGIYADFTGYSVAQAAAKILLENGNEPMSYRDIANLAVKRGWTNRRDSKRTPIETFFEILNRSRVKFESMGGELFRIKFKDPDLVNQFEESAIEHDSEQMEEVA